MSKWEEGTTGTWKDFKRPGKYLNPGLLRNQRDKSRDDGPPGSWGGRLKQTVWDLICAHELYSKGKGKSFKEAKGSHSKIPDSHGATRFLRHVPEPLNLHLERRSRNLPPTLFSLPTEVPSPPLLPICGLIPYPRTRARLSQWKPDPITPWLKGPRRSPSHPVLRTMSKVPTVVLGSPIILYHFP